MRFFEFEAREIVKRAGIPVTDYGFTTDADEAKAVAERIGGATVIKSQVLTGGRMKAGGVKFADTPEEAEAYARDILALEINGHVPRGVLVDPKAEVEQEYYAGVVWDGTAKKPLMLFSDMGGIDIEQVAEEHPDHVGRGHFSTIEPFSDFQAKQVIAAAGVTGRALQRATPVLARLARLFLDNDMTLAEINPLAELKDGSFVALDAHMEMEDEGMPRQKALLKALGIGEEEGTREGHTPSPFEEAVKAIDAADHRGVIQGKDSRLQRQHRPRHRCRRWLADAHRRGPPAGREAGQLLGDRRQPLGRQGLRARKAGAGERGRREDRGDDVDRLEHARGHRRPRRDQSLPGARQGPGRDGRDLPHPGRLGGGGLQDPRCLRDRVLRPLRVAVGGRRTRGREN